MTPQLSDITNLTHDIDSIHKLDWYLSHSVTASYTFTDDDKIKTLYMTTGASVLVATLPTAADNKYRVIEIFKEDSGAGSITVDGEGAETINGQTTIDIEVQYCGLRLKCDGTGWYVLDTIGDCELRSISGTLEMIYQKVFLGTTDADSLTNIAHGIADVDKILAATSAIYTTTDGWYLVYDAYGVADAARDYFLMWDGTNIKLNSVGANAQGEKYRVTCEYYI